MEIVTKKQTVKERVKAQAFSIIKISDNGAGEADKLAGVEFTVKSKKDIDADVYKRQARYTPHLQDCSAVH